MDGPLLVIDRDGTRPVGEQLVAGLRRGILDGTLRPGDPVPSTRALAAELGVARSSVVAAYDQLAGEGYLELRQGASTRVAQLERGRIRAATAATGAPTDAAAPAGIERAPLVDLRPGIPSTARLDERAWRAAWRDAARAGVPGTPAPPFGSPRLRAEIADHLRQARGVACSPDDIVVTAGTSDAIALLASAIDAIVEGTPRVAVEHPGYPSARRVLARRGAVRTVPVAVDDDGIDVAALAAIRPAPHAAMVTPSHQYPLGGRLPVAARLALLDWAEASGALVIEDDYDSEFRHLGAPLPALASLDRGGRVVLVGSFSKVLTPWVRLGYLVLPANPGLRAAVAAVRDDETCPVPGIAPEAIAALLASGAVRRHIAAARRDYAHRRRLVLEVLSGIEQAPLAGLDGGLHAVVHLPDHAAAAAVVARLEADGIAVAALGEYSAVPGAGPAGIVLGYAAPGDTRLAEALDAVRRVVLATLAGDGSRDTRAGGELERGPRTGG